MLKDKVIGHIENGVYVITEPAGRISNHIDWAEDVPAFLDGQDDGVYSGGDGSFIACINDASLQDLLNYTAKLESKGYKKFSENYLANNTFFTYENGKNYVHAYFIDSLHTVKVIAEPYYEFIPFTPEKHIVKPAIIASSVSDRTFYVRLPDNTLVVVDGGWRIEDRSIYGYPELIRQMYEEMSEITGKAEIIPVSLWIITHAHTDHAGVLEYLHTTPVASKFQIAQILYNFPAPNHLADEAITEADIQEMQNNLERWHANAGIQYPYDRIFYNCPFNTFAPLHYEEICREAFAKYNAIRVKAHTGMKLNLSGVVFDILHTVDDDMPDVFDNQNNLSIVIKMSYQGSSVLWLGDMGVIPSRSCVEMYGDFLECDVLQVSHHGWGGATEEFYQMAKPSVLLWNNSEFGFKYADKYQGYGKTKASTDLYNMSTVKRNIFCNRIRMTYVDLPVKVPKEIVYNPDDCHVLASGASDRTFMIRLPDNKIIVIDGGWRKEDWNDYSHQALIEKLYEEMRTLTKSDSVVIAAWIVTNSYAHNNRFLETYQDTPVANNIEIERIIYNFPPENKVGEQYTADNIPNYQEYIQIKYSNTGASLIKAETGANYCFSGLTVEVLHAPEEEYYDTIADASLVISCTFKGHRILFTGDMTDKLSEKLLLKYGQNLKCDAVQIANHGWNNSGILDFYKTCSAKVQLWNNSEYGYQFFRKGEGYKKSKTSTAVYWLETCRLNVFCDQVRPQIFSFPFKDEELE